MKSDKVGEITGMMETENPDFVIDVDRRDTL